MTALRGREFPPPVLLGLSDSVERRCRKRVMAVNSFIPSKELN
jgi:hypothetical protein